MDNPLCIDGHRCSPSGCGKTGSKTKCSVEYICNSAGCEFFLESYFLSCTGLWLCVFVADGSLGSYHRDDRVLSEGGQDCCAASDPVFFLGHFCCIPEFSGMAAEPIKISLPFCTLMEYNGISRQKGSFYYEQDYGN